MRIWSDGGRLKRLEAQQRQIRRELHRLADMTAAILENQENNMATLADIQAKAEQEHTLLDSLVALTEGLAQTIRDNATDPAALQALADELDNQTTEIADAVTANTPETPAAPA